MLTGDTNSSSYNLTHLYPLFATIKGQEDVYSSCCDFWNSLGVIPNSSLKQVVKYFRLKYPNVAATSVTLLSLSSNMCLACFILMFRIKSNGVRPVMVQLYKLRFRQIHLTIQINTHFNHLLAVRPHFIILTVHALQIKIQTITGYTHHYQYIEQIRPPSFIKSRKASDSQFSYLFTPKTIFIRRFHLKSISALTQMIIKSRVFSTFHIYPRFVHSYQPKAQ